MKKKRLEELERSFERVAHNLEHDPDFVADIREMLNSAKEARRLRKAIKRHKKDAIGSRNTSDHDRELWAVLNKPKDDKPASDMAWQPGPPPAMDRPNLDTPPTASS